MPASGSSVLTWGHRALTSAVETGSRLWARAAATSGGDRRPLERRSAERAPAISPPAPPQPPTPPSPTVPGRCVSATASAAQPRHPVPARAATASVTPAMVRRWAHEQGIQVADRGRIPQAVMARYLAKVARPAAGGRQPSRAPSKGRTPIVRPLPLSAA
ncbi:MAG: histone-like nucleoid-structuring protein Lsr2 [Mycobacterium leprae]